jgi:putative PIN family toxin of toxin-antitoxin system
VNILLDTNVLIAAFISRGSCNELLEHVVRYHRLVLSDYILDEFSGKLSAKFRFSKREVREARTLLSERATLVKPAKVETLADIDPDDLPILGTAVAARCDCLVTGDKSLLERGMIEGIPILSPSEFWRWEAEDRN